MVVLSAVFAYHAGSYIPRVVITSDENSSGLTSDSNVEASGNPNAIYAEVTLAEVEQCENPVKDPSSKLQIFLEDEDDATSVYTARDAAMASNSEPSNSDEGDVTSVVIEGSSSTRPNCTQVLIAEEAQGLAPDVSSFSVTEGQNFQTTITEITDDQWSSISSTDQSMVIGPVMINSDAVDYCTLPSNRQLVLRSGPSPPQHQFFSLPHPRPQHQVANQPLRQGGATFVISNVKSRGQPVQPARTYLAVGSQAWQPVRQSGVVYTQQSYATQSSTMAQYQSYPQYQEGIVLVPRKKHHIHKGYIVYKQVHRKSSGKKGATHVKRGLHHGREVILVGGRTWLGCTSLENAQNALLFFKLEKDISSW